MKQKVFGGTKSEKLDQAQLRFHLDELEKLAAKGEERIETITYERTRTKQTRAVPAEAFAQLPVAETIELVPEAVKAEPRNCMSGSARSGRLKSMSSSRSS